jgi:uncharacterized protein YndB with AHSA1/START domain
MPLVPPPFHFDRTWEFPVSPQEFWATISRTDDYTDWWSWLREFDAAALREDERWRAVIQSPLPYGLRFTLHMRKVEAPSLLEVDVAGDIAGAARLEVEPAGDGCAVRVSWKVSAQSAPLRMGALVARPLLQWSHERVVALGLAQFGRRALGAPS